MPSTPGGSSLGCCAKAERRRRSALPNGCRKGREGVAFSAQVSAVRRALSEDCTESLFGVPDNFGDYLLDATHAHSHARMQAHGLTHTYADACTHARTPIRIAACMRRAHNGEGRRGAARRCGSDASVALSTIDGTLLSEQTARTSDVLPVPAAP
jgi:hypothetical protein